MSDNDALGDRMKAYEAATSAQRAFKGQPFCVRLDGRNFSTFTQGLRRPFDPDMSQLMKDVTHDLVGEFAPLIGYTQSDEITLGFYLPADSQAEYVFDGKFQKLVSLTAAFASTRFMEGMKAYLPQKVGRWATFDSRAFVVPNLQELYHCFLWRQQDATKNAISMAASAYYSHRELHGKSGDEKQEMLFAKGVNFNDYPAYFKRGTFLQRVKKLVTLTPEQLEKIPEAHRPTGPVERTVIEEQDIWLSKTDNPVGRLFGVRAWMDAVGELKRLHSQDAAIDEQMEAGHA